MLHVYTLQSNLFPTNFVDIRKNTVHNNTKIGISMLFAVYKLGLSRKYIVYNRLINITFSNLF